MKNTGIMESLETFMDFYGYTLNSEGWFEDAQGKRITLRNYSNISSTYTMMKRQQS